METLPRHPEREGTRCTHCKFGTYLNDALRDRLVCGLRIEAIQKRLLAVKELTFKDALDQAQAMEAADRNAKSLHATETQAVHNIAQSCHPRKPPRTSAQPCYRCGRTNHDASACKFIDATCRACGKKGHISPVCRSKKQSEKKQHQGRPGR